MPDETQNTPTADELREAIRAEMKAEIDRQQSTIDDLIAEELKAIPEHLHKLLPEALAPLEQVRWLRKAKASGAFAPSTVVATDTRRPSNTPKPVDPASLSPIARIAAGYNTK